MSALIDIAERARQLSDQGLGLRDIASMLNVHEAQVARWLASSDHEQAAELHARVWQQEQR